MEYKKVSLSVNVELAHAVDAYARRRGIQVSHAYEILAARGLRRKPPPRRLPGRPRKEQA